MKLLKLTGKYAVGEYAHTMVDDDDYDRIMELNRCWNAHPKIDSKTKEFKRDKNNKIIIRPTASINGKNVVIYRFIMNATDPNMKIDHINHNTLDNRKENLRFATNQQNIFNESSRKNSTSKYLGVCWDKSSKKWRYTFSINGIQKSESCKSEEEAAYIRDLHALKYHGDFANLNFPEKIDEYKEVIKGHNFDKEINRTSKYRCVYLTNKGKWNSFIVINRKTKHIGTYVTEVEAAESYDLFILKNEILGRELNFPEKMEKYEEIIKNGMFGIGRKCISQYTGLVYRKNANKWISSIIVDKTYKYLGIYTDEENAAEAYDYYIVKNNLDRKLNFPEKLQYYLEQIARMHDAENKIATAA